VFVSQTSYFHFESLPHLSRQNDGAIIKHYEEFFDFDTKRGRLDVLVEGIPNEVESVSSFYSRDSKHLIEIKSEHELYRQRHLNDNRLYSCTTTSVLSLAKNQNVSCKVEPMDPASMNPVSDLVDFDPLDKTVMFGPMAIWKWVGRRMNSEKPVRLHMRSLDGFDEQSTQSWGKRSLLMGRSVKAILLFSF
jgi:hypothetical protein